MNNPFKPTAGAEPPRIIGRDDAVLEFVQGLEEGVGAPGRLMRITGPRGSGKTVLLSDYAEKAAERGWRTANVWADTSLIENLTYELSPRETLESASFKGSVAAASAEVTLDIKRANLRTLMKDAAQSSNGLLITLDEVQDAKLEDMQTIANSIQILIREKQNVAFVFAGLPMGVLDLINGKALTFLRRAASHELGYINEIEVALSLADSFAATGLELSGDALASVAKATGGYAFLIQLVGYYVWQRADFHRASSAVVSAADVEQGTAIAMARFEQMVYEPAVANLSDRASAYLVAMAHLGNRANVSDVAAELGGTAKAFDSARRSLAQREVLHSPARGVVEFSIPFMRDFVLRNEEELLARA